MSLSSSAAASATSAAASATSSASSGTIHTNQHLKVVGILLAIVSGLLIGSSFVFKKKGLLRSQAGHVAGEGVAYLKSPLWWLGMTMMICGELCNFAAYAFVEAIIVTPLGALSVVISAILSSLFLNEKLTVFGWLGCILCLLGSTIIALNGPQESSVGQIVEFQALFLAPGFLAFAGVLIAASLSIIIYFGPRHGDKHMLWYISVCSMIGGISVSVTTGLGAAIVTTAMGDNQFKHWFIYFLIIFVAVTLVTEVLYLNKALALFNTAMVTPTYYVIFTFCTMVTTVVLFQGLKASASQILTVVLAFFSICIGITILQLSKVDPVQLKGLDRRSTMLLMASRQNTQGIDEKNLSAVEDPGIDTLRGSFGTVGSIIRARSAKRMSMMSASGRVPGATLRARHGNHAGGPDDSGLPRTGESGSQFLNMPRHQLYDNPVPGADSEAWRRDSAELASMHTNTTYSPTNPPQSPAARTPTIKFGERDLVHSYVPPGTGQSGVPTHDYRAARGRPTPPINESRELDPEALRHLPLTASPGELDLQPGSRTGTFGRSADWPPQSAPATDGRFYRPPAHDPYEHAPATAREPHPSTSIDSVGSVLGGADADDDDDLPPAKPLFARQDSPRRYPGQTKDDEEESLRLWNRGSMDSGEGSVSGSAAAIRLVAPSPGGKF